MTDEDIYAKSLGRKFSRVRGELCRPQDDFRDSSRVVADYLRGELRRGVPDFGERCRRSIRIIRRSGLFAAEDAQQQLEHAATESLGAQHIAEAAYRTIEEHGDPAAFFRNLAELGVYATRARLAVQIHFKDDSECHRAFDAIRADIVETYAQVLAAPHDVAMPAPHVNDAMNLDELLNFVVYREPQ